MAGLYGDATFTYAVLLIFLFVKQMFIGLYCMLTLGLNFLFVFEEGRKYTEMNNIWSLPLKSSEPNKEVPKLS